MAAVKGSAAQCPCISFGFPSRSQNCHCSSCHHIQERKERQDTAPVLLASFVRRSKTPSQSPSDFSLLFCQCRRCGFDPCMGKIPWKKKGQPIPVFLPGKFHGQRSLASYSPWGHRVGQDLTTEQQQQRLTMGEWGAWESEKKCVGFLANYLGCLNLWPVKWKCYV